ncbi:MAG: HAMP domain-containing protein [Gemmatimonadetes bacterium]|nr:HAMP domain-containing protein [Gemmatimonadota bacterium]
MHRHPLRRELLLAFAILFVSATFLTLVAVFLAFPDLQTPGGAALFLGGLLVIYLLLFFFIGGAILNRLVAQPMEEMVADVKRIAAGDLEHRLPSREVIEFSALSGSVNEMAVRLIRDQDLLAENVQSLEATNLELVRARAEVIRAARLATVGTLAAGIAHEVGNPLAAIIGYVDVARSRAVRNGQDVELLEAIRAEAARIDRIVRGLLDYARPREVDAAPMDIGNAIDRVRDLLAQQGRLEGVEIDWVVPEGKPLARADLHRFEQVLVNLLLNALDALVGIERPWIGVTVQWEVGPAQGRPERREDDPPGINYAHKRRARGTSSELGSGVGTAKVVVVVEVEDNGPGLPEGDPDRVFDPFFTTKEPGKGTGLGLAICARLIEGMGGHIAASRRAEGGARFTVRLPGAAEDHEEGSRSDSPALSREVMTGMGAGDR